MLFAVKYSEEESCHGMAVSVGRESDTIAEVDADCQFVACSQTSQQTVSAILMAPTHTFKWHCVKPPTPKTENNNNKKTFYSIDQLDTTGIWT